jgi:hypothetical protein
MKITFRPPNYPQTKSLLPSDLNLYYNVRHPLWYNAPTGLPLLGVPRTLYEQREIRLATWFGKKGFNPFVVVETAYHTELKKKIRTNAAGSQSTPDEMEVYERTLRVPFTLCLTVH